LENRAAPCAEKPIFFAENLIGAFLARTNARTFGQSHNPRDVVDARAKNLKTETDTETETDKKVKTETEKCQNRTITDRVYTPFLPQKSTKISRCARIYTHILVKWAYLHLNFRETDVFTSRIRATRVFNKLEKIEKKSFDPSSGNLPPPL
jgi:hypothetical protein